MNRFKIEAILMVAIPILLFVIGIIAAIFKIYLNS